MVRRRGATRWPRRQTIRLRPVPSSPAPTSTAAPGLRRTRHRSAVRVCWWSLAVDVDDSGRHGVGRGGPGVGGTVLVLGGRQCSRSVRVGRGGRGRWSGTAWSCRRHTAVVVDVLVESAGAVVVVDGCRGRGRRGRGRWRWSVDAQAGRWWWWSPARTRRRVVVRSDGPPWCSTGPWWSTWLAAIDVVVAVDVVVVVDVVVGGVVGATGLVDPCCSVGGASSRSSTSEQWSGAWSSWPPSSGELGHTHRRRAPRR